MTRAAAAAVLLVAACGGACGGAGGGDDDGDTDAAVDGDGGVTEDGWTVDTPPAGDGPTGGSARVLFQCHAFDGGLCTIDDEGDNRQTLHASGFVPHGLGDGSILFHTASYRVARRSSSGNVADLGDGAFARPHPDGRILFQCAGLGGGLCVMDADGSNRSTVKATGRVPDVDASGRILFHSDDYHVWRRDADGDETDLGPGAFATWSDDGRVVFQCTGLDGGLCRMDADGSSRETLAATGRVPDEAGGRVVFHSESYQVTIRTGASTSPLGAGANAVFW